MQGHNDDAHERNGTLTLLTPDLTTELGRVELRRLGIIRLTADTSASDVLAARVTAELYCEQMELRVG